MRAKPQSVPVFLFYVDGSGVAVFPSLEAAAGWVEAIDVVAGEYAMITVDGDPVDASVSGRYGQDVVLRATGKDAAVLLRTRLVEVLPTAGVDVALAQAPRLAAQALADAQWTARWPHWPEWLHRRLHGEGPVLFPE